MALQGNKNQSLHGAVDKKWSWIIQYHSQRKMASRSGALCQHTISTTRVALGGGRNSNSRTDSDQVQGV